LIRQVEVTGRDFRDELFRRGQDWVGDFPQDLYLCLLYREMSRRAVILERDVTELGLNTHERAYACRLHQEEAAACANGLAQGFYSATRHGVAGAVRLGRSQSSPSLPAPQSPSPLERMSRLRRAVLEERSRSAGGTRRGADAVQEEEAEEAEEEEEEASEGERARRAAIQEREEAAVAEFVRRRYRKAARMCPQCRCGPVIAEGGWNLATHHRKFLPGRKAGIIDNACAKCGFFALKVSTWPPWDGVLRRYPSVDDSPAPS